MATTPRIRVQPAVAGRAHISSRHLPSHRRSTCLRASAAPYKAYSQMIDRYLMLFLVQQDLGVQLQRAMNTERYDLVQEVQKRKAEAKQLASHTQKRQIEKVMESQRSERDTEGYVSSDEGLDTLTQIAALQAQMNAAVESEDFALAATLRDKMRTVKEGTAAMEEQPLEEPPKLALGQRVLLHDGDVLNESVAGVVVGWDRSCCEGAAWKARSGAEQLSKGEEQVFYHLLLDMREWQANEWDATVMPVAYAAEETLSCPADNGRTWLQEYDGQQRASFIHPYEYLFFLGPDNHGNFLPSPQLRNLYGAPRRDVFPVPEDDGYDGGSSDSGSGSS